MTDNEYREGQLLEQRHQLQDPPEPPHAFRDEDEVETEWLVQMQLRGDVWTTCSIHDTSDAANEVVGNTRKVYSARVVRREIRTHVETA